MAFFSSSLCLGHGTGMLDLAAHLCRNSSRGRELEAIWLGGLSIAKKGSGNRTMNIKLSPLAVSGSVVICSDCNQKLKLDILICGGSHHKQLCVETVNCEASATGTRNSNAWPDPSQDEDSKPVSKLVRTQDRQRVEIMIRHGKTLNAVTGCLSGKLMMRQLCRY